MVKYYYLIFLLLLIMPFVSGYTEVYQEDTEVDLKQGCYNNGTLCSSSATCNITVIDPSRLPLVNNDVMTQHITRAYFNYTLNITQTSEVGQYEYRIVCQDTGLANFGTFEFLVTSSGNDPSLAEVVTYGVLGMFLVFLFILSVVGVAKLPRSNKVGDDGIIDVNFMKYVRQILFFMAYILMIGITYFAWQISENLIFLDIISNFTKVLFYLLAYTLAPAFGVFMLFVIIMAINDKRIQKAMVRGVPVR